MVGRLCITLNNYYLVVVLEWGGVSAGGRAGEVEETKSVSVAETQLALAEVAVEQQQSARASSLAQQAASTLHRGKSAHLEARAYLLLGRAALQQKRVAQAQKFFEQTSSLASKNPDPDQRVEFAAW